MMTDKVKTGLQVHVLIRGQTVTLDATFLKACMTSVVVITQLVQRIQGVSQQTVLFCYIRLMSGISLASVRRPGIAKAYRVISVSLTSVNSFSLNIPVPTVNCCIVHDSGALVNYCVIDDPLRSTDDRICGHYYR